MVAIVDAVGAGAAASYRALRKLPSRRDEMLGALNGLVGDLLVEQGHRLAISMRLRVDGDTTGRLCVLGAPNRGATVEQLANAILSGINSVPLGVAQSLGRLVDRRSAGIKDLRHGSLVDEDWRLGRRHPVELPAGADVFVGCASL